MMKKHKEHLSIHLRILSSLFKREDTLRFRRAYLRLSGQVSRFYRDERRSRIVNEHAGRVNGARERRVSLSAGFTVIELIIAVGLFISLFGIVSGSFVNAMRTERKLVAMVAANDSMNTSIEQMAREIRTASNFMSAAPESLQFINYKGEDVTYALVEGAIERTVLGMTPKKITADNVNVKTLSFILCDASTVPACLTSRITIVLGASPADPSLALVVLNLQTTVSARF